MSASSNGSPAQAKGIKSSLQRWCVDTSPGKSSTELAASGVLPMLGRVDVNGSDTATTTRLRVDARADTTWPGDRRLGHPDRPASTVDGVLGDGLSDMDLVDLETSARGLPVIHGAEFENIRSCSVQTEQSTPPGCSAGQKSGQSIFGGVCEILAVSLPRHDPDGVVIVQGHLSFHFVVSHAHQALGRASGRPFPCIVGSGRVEARRGEERRGEERAAARRYRMITLSPLPPSRTSSPPRPSSRSLPGPPSASTRLTWPTVTKPPARQHR